MFSLLKFFFFCFLFLLLLPDTYGQQSISNKQKMRYLKKTERKNDRYIKLQEKKTYQLLSKLSRKEQALYKEIDFTTTDSSLMENSFSKIEEKLQDKKPEEFLQKVSTPVSIGTSFSTTTISENLSSDVRDYLKQQLSVTSFFSDSTCSDCEKLKSQTRKAKENISKTSEKLERLKSIQADIKKHQETLKNYGVQTPELAGKLKDIDKNCYYFTQGMNGFKDLYTNPAKGIENSLLKKLSFSKDFKLFETQFNSIPISGISALPGSTSDMSAYQTKAQVQAMLPQNAPGIDAETKAALLSNMQNSLTRFNELKNEQPDISLLKDKPTFKINPYKGLPLRQRLVPGFTFQPQIKQLNQPITIDLGATLGFKLTERLTPLIGASAKTGWGKDIRHLAFTYQGIVAKAGIDTKLMYGFSFQTWYEATWKPQPDLLLEDRNPNYPEPSFIAGICNTYQISKKVKGILMIGYDFFYNKHTPYTSPWVIRMGWQ